MKAITLIKHGSPEKAFETREQPIPEPGENEVLIKSEAFGLNFADVLARNGFYRDAPPPPCVLGYEVVGTIEKTGGKVRDFKTGQRVVAFTRFGGYAEYAVTDQRAVAVIPEDIDSGVAAALATQYCTAWFAAHEAANMFSGENVLIHSAAGGVGTALVQLAKRQNCTIFGTAGSDKKLEYLKKQGVHHPINYRTDDYEKRINEIAGKHKMDMIFNAVGGKTVRKDKKLLAFGGRLVVYGAAGRMDKGKTIFSTLKLLWEFGLVHPVFLIMKSQSIIGVNMLRIADYKPEQIQKCIQKVVGLTAKGELQPVVGGKFKADAIAEAHGFLENRESIGKVVVEW